MDPNHVPLIGEAEQITTEWIRQALAAGGASAASDIAAAEVEQLSDVTNALVLSQSWKGRGRSDGIWF
ncbi:MAG: hypothetical protein OXK82_12660, partial [Deltaproteobacteria bacterium]|nr:hypothetical protein [Deltaproteobacteria bacterium]MDE2960389.1 hypothetical protein [Chloroflexota bacterium]